MELIIQRIFIATAVILFFFTFIKLYRYWNLIKMQKNIKNKELPIALKPGIPSLIYFWSPTCAPCKLQEKYLEDMAPKLRQKKMEVDLIKINAQNENNLISILRIATVPTTVLINAHGKIAALNTGLTQSDIILNQLTASN